MSDTSITITEQQLEILEDKIRFGLASFVEVGTALREIKEANAFTLRGFKNFDDYCAKTFGFSERNGYRMIAAAQTSDKIKDIVGEAPRNEASARVLKQIADEPKIVERVAAQLKRSNQTIATATAEKLQQVIDRVKPAPKPTAEAKPAAKPAPIMPTLSDTCPHCHLQPGQYVRREDGWHCGRNVCDALVMVGVIPITGQACPECGAAILTTGAEFCETCGCYLAVTA